MQLQQCKKYIVSEKYPVKLKTAGALTLDNECFLNSMGFATIQLGVFTKKTILAQVIRAARVLKYAIVCPINSVIVFHFPLRTSAFTLLQKMLKWKGCTTIAIVVDIDGWRDDDTALLQAEVKILANFNFIIAHNNAMCLQLLKYITKVPIHSIDIFDYAAIDKHRTHQLANTICIAANFKKATFVQKLSNITQLQFNLFGSGLDANLILQQHHVHAIGSFNHIELVERLEGSFGLVWDGDSIDTCSAYYQINNPHKLSLYLAAGLPLIVWHKSPFATIVLQQGLGFAVHTLYEIPTILYAITNEQYGLMLYNVEKYRAKVVTGFYLKKVMHTILQGKA
jgi:hypothetical protein